MKKHIWVALLLLGAASAGAEELDQLQRLNQAEFRLLSEDLGGVVSSKSYVPSAPMGVTGFDLAVNVTGTSLQNRDLFDRTSSSTIPSTFQMINVRAMKGLPWDIDIGASYSYIPGTDIKVYGGEVRRALVSGGVLTPSISMRGTYSRLEGVDQLEFDTWGVDFSISKKIFVVTPYGGAGYVWVTSEPQNVAGLRKETFGVPKVFAGVRASLGVAGFTFEVDRTGEAVTYGLRFGVGW